MTFCACADFEMGTFAPGITLPTDKARDALDLLPNAWRRGWQWSGEGEA
jgi:hypothetical protein